MDVSICIVNWNTKDLIYKCIRSIKEKTTGVTYEIIVVDNNSQDSSTKMLKEQFPDCRVIESKVNLGFVKGNNRAVQEASGKYILYLNPDTELVTNAIYGMFNFLELNKTFGAVGCRLTNKDGSIQYTCASTFPTPLNELCFFLFLYRIFPNIKMFSSRELVYWDHKDSRSVDCLSGACMMVSKNIINKLGGFDEKIFMYSEDLDLCFRILKDGWKIYYLSTEAIIHYEGSSTQKKKNVNFSILLQRQSNYYFIFKNLGSRQAKYYRVVVFIGSLFRIFLGIVILLISIISLKKKYNYPHRILDKYLNSLLWSIGLRDVKKFI